MGFKLKQKYEVFTVVDGPFAGRTYRHEQVYNEVPPQEKYKFDQIEVEESKKEMVTESQIQKVKKKNPETIRPLDTETDEPKGGQ